MKVNVTRKVYALRNDISKVGEQLFFKVHIEKMLNWHIYTKNSYTVGIHVLEF